MLAVVRLRSLALSTVILLACGAGTNEPPTVPPVPASASAAVAPPAPAPPPAPEPTASAAPLDPGPPAAPAPATLKSKALPLPGSPTPLSYDYLAVDRAAGRVYVPVGNTGSLDVLDIATGAFTRVDGFKTEEREYKGKKRIAGPSAATVGDGVVYVGNRATSEICVVDARTLKLGKCVKLATPTDGVAYVASVKEVWVTTPRDQSLTILDASKPDALKPKTVIKLPGDPEGYAVDDGKGLFFTNLEDKGPTVVIDVRTHKVKSTWSASCGSDGPRGIAIDPARGLLFVACTDHVQVLDAAHDGAPLAKVDTGAGVDNLDYVADKGLLYVAAGKAATVTVAHVDDKGQPQVVATGPTVLGARNAVADANGNAYVPDPTSGALLVLSQSPGRQ